MQPLSDHTGTTDATPVGKTDRDSDYDTMTDYHRRRRHAWDSDSSEEDDEQQRPESPWKNKDGVPLVLEAVNRKTRKDVSPSVVNPDPRNQILDDLTDLINEWKEKGYHPLIGIDANATLDETKFAEFLDRNQLVDV